MLGLTAVQRDTDFPECDSVAVSSVRPSALLGLTLWTFGSPSTSPSLPQSPLLLCSASQLVGPMLSDNFSHSPVLWVPLHLLSLPEFMFRGSLSSIVFIRFCVSLHANGFSLFAINLLKMKDCLYDFPLLLCG